MNKKEKVLVTGGAGFIGSNIVGELLKQGYQVSVIDNLITGKKENLEPYLSSIKFIQGSIMDEEKINEAIEDIDYVLHQAALPAVPRSIEEPMSSLENNTAATLKMLSKSQEYKVKKFVYASSSSIYGDQEAEYKREDLKPKPLSPYAVFKLAGEQLCRVYANLHNLPAVCLRYFNVFGPNQDPDSPYSAVMPIFIKAMLNNEPAAINGDGAITRDFTYVVNNVTANLLAMKSEKVGRGEVINIAMGQEVSLNELVEQINSLLNKNIEPIHREERPGDIKRSLADISRARELLNYQPIVSFKEGLEKTIEYYEKLLKVIKLLNY
ncbi:SDR family oxidoreductase [Patescibacteria group bacterium]|nr:SDR family oxidoreductase [Patescibacteria group bacterium]